MEAYARTALLIFGENWILKKIKMNKIRISNLVIPVLISVFLVSCKPEDKPHFDDFLKEKGVFICNEGNYTYGNASLSFYDPEINKVENDIFHRTNGFPLGDVCQSMLIVDSLGFLVMNNSGNILVINTTTFKHAGTIAGLSSPRFMVKVSDSLAYVSDLYSPMLTIVNTKKLQVSGHVWIGKGSEQMLKYGNDVIVCSWSFNNKVYRINSLTHTLEDSLEVVLQPNSMVLDKNNKLWVLSDGGFPGMPGGQQNAALSRINAENFSIEQVMSFPDLNASPTRLSLNASADTLFFINSGWGGNNISRGGVYRMPVSATSLPAQAFIPQGNRLFYGLGIDPVSSMVYVSDAIDYAQQGWVLRYSQAGALVDSFKVEISPGYFCFKP